MRHNYIADDLGGALGSGLERKSVCRVSDIFSIVAMRHSPVASRAARNSRKVGCLPKQSPATQVLPRNLGVHWDNHFTTIKGWKNIGLMPQPKLSRAATNPDRVGAPQTRLHLCLCTSGVTDLQTPLQ